MWLRMANVMGQLGPAAKDAPMTPSLRQQKADIRKDPTRDICADGSGRVPACTSLDDQCSLAFLTVVSFRDWSHCYEFAQFRKVDCMPYGAAGRQRVWYAKKHGAIDRRESSTAPLPPGNKSLCLSQKTNSKPPTPAMLVIYTTESAITNLLPVPGQK
ncbi:uncharacterized protein CLUP02_06120 [Colletotrichum lupini]|uniref:Uncharacterized protein n=1 Tax=Colletotrichum lupini TaxID=145971 RepID=A0A9Q8SNI8_9PEZI|nr:uncharacterized protein CLUP02_06120 [Colletotrichum lupini]UQC80637.1 hypothetical protein CLUP02_06120 [Colletotrichum lupini]